MKSDRSHLCTTRRLLLHRISVCALLVLLPLASFGKVAKPKPAAAADVPSGFLPGLINYFAGDGTSSGTYTDGAVPTAVSIGTSFAVADTSGNMYIAATSGAIYIVYAGGTVPTALANVTTSASPAVTPVTGRIYEVAGLQGACGGASDPTLCGEGKPLNQVLFGSINGLAIDSNNNIYYSDEANSSLGSFTQVVRRIDSATSIVTTIAGQLGNTSSSPDIGDGGPATSATLNYPTDVQVDSSGNVYIADSVNYVVRVVYSGTQPPPIVAAEGLSLAPGQIISVAGQIQTFCPNAPDSGSPGAPGGCGDYGPATSGLGTISFLAGFSLDSAGNIYIPDSDPFISPVPAYVRVVYAGGTVPPLLNLALNPAGGSDVTPTPGYIYAVTGYGLNPQFTICSATPCGDGGLAANMELGTPNTIGYYASVVDAQGNFYLVDPLDFAVRKIDTSGYASTIAGIDDPAQTPPSTLPLPGNAATSTQLISPNFINFDAQNNLYIADSFLEWIVAPLQPQTITFPAFNPATVTYGQIGETSITLTATASSTLPVSYTVTGPATLNGDQLQITGAGTVSVTASQPGNTQFSAAPPVTQTLTVGPAALTVTAVPASKIAGAANPTFSAVITGFVNGDTATTPGAYTGAPAFSTTATTTSPVGTYPLNVTIGTLASTNYQFTSFQNSTLTITGTTTQTITFPKPAPVNYGSGPVSLTATASSGLPVGFLVLSGPGIIPSGSSTLTITGAGTIVIAAYQEGNSTYQAAPQVMQPLTVNPAILTITGPTVSLMYGTTIDPATFPPATITGFVGSDTAANVVIGSAQYSIPSPNPNVGTYTITVGLGTLAILPAYKSTYQFATPVPGSLTVTPAPQTIIFNPVPASQTYGSQPGLTAAASSGGSVTFTATGPAEFLNGYTSPNISTPVQVTFNGVGTVVLTATQPGSGNYGPVSVSLPPITVTQAPLNIYATSISREQGAPNPDTFAYTIGAAANTPGGFLIDDTDIPSVISGIPNVVTAATQDSPAGTYDIVVSQGTLAAPNYYFVFLNGTLTITPPGSINMAASPATLTIQPGLSAQSTLTLTPVNLYQGVVTLSCGQVPANVSCVVSPSTYVFPGSQNADGSENAAQGTVTITASSATVVGAVREKDSASRAAFFLIPGGLAGLLIAFSRRRAAGASAFWGAIAFFALGVGMLGIASCGGSSSMNNAKPGSATIMITGTGTTASGVGAVTATVPLTVTIQ